MSGHPASGKSAVAQRLGNILESTVVDENNRSFHQAAINHALTGIEAGHSVIVVLPINEQVAATRWIYQLLSQVEKLSADLSYVWVQTDAPTARIRVEARAQAFQDPADLVILKRWEEIEQNYSWNPEDWLPDFIFDNGATATEESDKSFLSYALSLLGEKSQHQDA